MTGFSKTEYQFIIHFQEMARRMHILAKEKGFYDKPRSTAEAIALMHSELSEALEADRKNLMDDKLPHRKGLEVEFADCIIRIMDTAAHLGLDVAEAIIEKHNYNQSRPYKHGKEY